MATEQVEATRYICSDPKCTVSHVAADGTVPPGYTLLVGVPDATRSTAGNQVGREVEAYACQLTHVRGAIEAVTAPIRRPDGGKPGKSAPSSDGEPDDGPVEDRLTDEEDAALEDGYDGPVDAVAAAGSAGNGARP